MENKLIENETPAKSAEELSDNELDSVSGGTGFFESKTKRCPVCCKMISTEITTNGSMYEFRCSCGTVFKIAYTPSGRPAMVYVAMIKGEPNPFADWYDARMVWRNDE